MTHWQQVRTIARWEFSRFVRWRQQFIGVLVMLGVGGLSAGVGKWVSGSRSRPVTVAVVGTDRLGFPLPAVDGVSWDSTRYASAVAADDAVRMDSVAGSLVVTTRDSVAVTSRRRAAWTERVAPAFNAARRNATYAALPLTDADRVALATSIDVAVHVADGRTGDRGAARVYAMAIVGIGLLVLVNGFAFLFTGITGEKQQRITEQMLAMVTPQAWMDGKILGLAGVAFVGTAFLAGTGMLALKLVPLATGRAIPALPPLPADLGAMLIVVIAVALGTAMWFSFMAAVAATIDDPNASPRTSLLMLPMLPMGFAFALVSRADSVVAQVLSMVPLTSMAVLPIRLMSTTVPWWEPIVALPLLALTAWSLRRIAGKIFAAGVLLYGKEPSMQETLRWIRDAD
jgi:ABC-2 type transport system permease protein